MSDWEEYAVLAGAGLLAWWILFPKKQTYPGTPVTGAGSGPGAGTPSSGGEGTLQKVPPQTIVLTPTTPEFDARGKDISQVTFIVPSHKSTGASAQAKKTASSK